jgi:hypothetical protein
MQRFRSARDHGTVVRSSGYLWLGASVALAACSAEPADVETAKLAAGDSTAVAAQPGDGEIPVIPGAAPARSGDPVAQLAITGTHLRKAQSNLCLVARIGSGERPVQQTVCSDFSDQGWLFFGDGNVVQIFNVDRGQCIVTRGTGESKAVTTTCNASFADQLWIPAFDTAFGGFHFVNLHSGLCLVARGSSQAVQSICGNFSDQVWLLD